MRDDLIREAFVVPRHGHERVEDPMHPRPKDQVVPLAVFRRPYAAIRDAERLDAEAGKHAEVGDTVARRGRVRLACVRVGTAQVPHRVSIGSA